jgi:regulator of cell morphogenesis and NO signaling
MKPDMDQTVREIAIQHPECVPVFESLGIDYCCGGHRTLREACERSHVPVEEAIRLLSGIEGRKSESAESWAQARLKDLSGHIVEKHHDYIRRESPRLMAQLEKVVDRHGNAHPEVCAIRDLFVALTDELRMHMMKEENVLFPYLVRTEAAMLDGQKAPPAMFGSVEVPISRMLADHEDAGELSGRIRSLSGDFHPPGDACPTYRALYHGLEEFERDLHQHVHLENNILFPRALEMERKEKAHVGS